MCHVTDSHAFTGAPDRVSTEQRRLMAIRFVNEPLHAQIVAGLVTGTQ